MKNTILNIIKTSIETKSILLDDVLITTIEMVVEKMVNALQNKNAYIFVAMVAVRLMLNIWLQN